MRLLLLLLSGHVQGEYIEIRATACVPNHVRIRLSCIFLLSSIRCPMLPDQSFSRRSCMCFLVYSIIMSRKLLSWYYRRKLSKNETTLKTLKKKKVEILDEVSETEKYKQAREIFEKYAPERLNPNLGVKFFNFLTVI